MLEKNLGILLIGPKGLRDIAAYGMVSQLANSYSSGA